MLTLIVGRGKSGKTETLLKKVKDCPAKGMAQRIVIVPEQLSHMTERNLSMLCGDSISYVSEVLSFTQLHSRVCSLSGGGARQVLDASGRILTARLALDSIRHRLKVFAAPAGKADFLGSMVSMIDELKSYDITPEILSETAKNTTGMFSEKLSELSLILSSYEAVTARGSADPRDNLTLLQKNLREGDYAAGRYFFVDGFTDFSAQELGVLRELLLKCEEMTITVPCDDVFGTSALFSPGRETAQRLLKLAEECGKETEIIKTSFCRPLPEDLTYLERNLFHYSAGPFTGKPENIFVSGLSDPLTECRRCGAVLKEFAMQGVRYRDMMVCAGSEDSYGPLLETVFRTMDIPLYRSEKRNILSHRAVAFVLLALEAAGNNLETETVTAYFKTGYSGISPDLCDLMENYALTWSIRGVRWQKKWTMHPEGYDGRFTPEVEEALEELNRQKDAALAPILALKNKLSSAENVHSQLFALFEFLEKTKLYESLELEISAYTEEGNQEKAQETAQIWGYLMDCLQQIHGVLGNTQQKTEELLRILTLSLGQYQVGTIPAVLDAVSFGGIDKARGQEPKLLYILGANDGSLPAVVSGGSLLSERERNILKDDFQIQLAPDSEGNLQRQLLTIYSALTSPTQKLYLSYSTQNAGEQLQPSFLVGRMQKLLPEMNGIGQLETEYTAESAAAQYLSWEGQMEQATLTAAISRASREITALAEAIARGKQGAVPRQERIRREEAEALFGTPVALTASRLDQLGNCPLSFFLNYGLKAKARKAATFDAAEFGTFIHFILEQTVKTLAEKDEIAPLDREESAKMVQAQLVSYAESRMGQEDQTSRQEYLFLRNGEEAAILLEEVSWELSNSDFHPAAFELQFGGKGDLPPLGVRGKLGEGRLSGFVDRADLWQNGEDAYLRIIDYKSGTKTFDYTELFGGVGMQMLLYLFALKDGGVPGVSEHPVPAGVLYMSAKRPFVSGDGSEGEVKATKRSGLILGEEPVLKAMEHGEKFEFMPVQKTKSGLGDNAVSRQQFGMLEDFVEKRMGEAVDRILSGDFSAQPFYRGRSHDPCSYCDYSEVCQKDPAFRREHYQEPLSAKAFWEKVGGEDDE